MKFSETKFPEVPVRPGFTKSVSGSSEEAAKILAESGVGIISFGMMVGDVVEMPESIDDLKVTSRQVQKNKDTTEKLIAVMRNGNPGWLSASALRIRDAKFNPVGPVSTELNICGTDLERIEKLYGKTLTVKEMAEIDVAIFGPDGMPTTETKKKSVPVIIYA